MPGLLLLVIIVVTPWLCVLPSVSCVVVPVGLKADSPSHSSCVSLYPGICSFSIFMHTSCYHPISSGSGFLAKLMENLTGQEDTPMYKTLSIHHSQSKFTLNYSRVLHQQTEYILDINITIPWI